MDKHILIEVDEREIETHYFNNYDSAYAYMAERLKAVNNKWDEDDEGDEWGLDTHSAWVNDVQGGHNFSWKIEMLPK